MASEEVVSWEHMVGYAINLPLSQRRVRITCPCGERYVVFLPGDPDEPWGEDGSDEPFKFNCEDCGQGFIVSKKEERGEVKVELEE